MNNLTMKRVAFGLFLATYAAGSAFALNASTVKTITGNAPVINAKQGVSTTQDSLDIRVLSNKDGQPLASGAAWSVGDKIEVSFKVNDADGDWDRTITAKTIYFTYFKDGAWSTYSNEGVVITAATENNGTQTVTWAIPISAINATKIGFAIRPHTTYGSPYYNNWKFVADITSSDQLGDGGQGNVDGPNDKPGEGQSTKPDGSNPIAPPSGGGAGSGGTVAPSPNNPNGENPGIQPSDSFGVKIVRVGQSGAANEYQAQNGAIAEGKGTDLKLTNAHEAQVWVGDTDVTSSAGFKNYDWYVTGGNAAAKGAVAASVDNVYFVQSGANKQYTLPVNKDAKLVGASAAQNQAIQKNKTAGAAAALSNGQPEAGVQGFKLGVWIH